MNKRVFYAGRQIGFAQDGTSTIVEAHGVQSVGITTSFNLEQVFELGQLSIYQQIEQIPDIELTMEKVLDGYPLLYHLATNGATSGTITGRSNLKTIVHMSVFSDTSDSASGTPVAEVSMSGMFVSSLTYTIPVDGNCTEAITLVGNNKIWRDDETLGNGVFTGRFNNQDQPLAIGASGGVQRRQHVIMVPITGGSAPNPTGLDANGATVGWVTTLPTDIPGILSSGIVPVDTDGTFLVPVQGITITPFPQVGQHLRFGSGQPQRRHVRRKHEVPDHQGSPSGRDLHPVGYEEPADQRGHDGRRCRRRRRKRQPSLQLCDVQRLGRPAPGRPVCPLT
jgi:hypothetical protein